MHASSSARRAAAPSRSPAISARFENRTGHANATVGANNSCVSCLGLCWPTGKPEAPSTTAGPKEGTMLEEGSANGILGFIPNAEPSYP